MIVEILSAVLGSSLLGTIFSSVMYYKSTKRLKELEILTANANARLKLIEADVARNDGDHKARELLHGIISELNSLIKDVIVSSGDLVDILNKLLLDEINDKNVQTKRLRKYLDELLECKNEIIKLTSEKAEMQKLVDHYKNWMCEREYSDCSRRKPELKIKCPYRPLNE